MTSWRLTGTIFAVALLAASPAIAQDGPSARALLSAEALKLFEAGDVRGARALIDADLARCAPRSDSPAWCLDLLMVASALAERTGDAAAAMLQARSAWAIAARHLPDSDGDKSRSARTLADMLRVRADGAAEAEPLMGIAATLFAGQAATIPSAVDEAIDTRESHALLLGRLDRLREAAVEGTAAIEAARRAWAPEDPRVAALGERLLPLARAGLKAAIALQEQDRLAAAAAIARPVLALQRAIAPTGAAGALVDLPPTLLLMGHIFSDLAQLPDAEAHYREALDLYLAGAGDRDGNTGVAYASLSHILNLMGRYAEAEPFARRAVTISEAVYGGGAPKTADAYDELGYTLGRLGRLDDASSFYIRALKIREATLGAADPRTITSYGNIGYLYGQIRDYPKAEYYHRKVLAARTLASGEQHPDVATALNNLGINLAAQGRHAEAEALLRRAAVILEHVRGADHPDTARQWAEVAAELEAGGRAQEAATLLDRSMNRIAAVLPASHADLMYGWSRLAALEMRALARPSDALDHMRRSTQVARLRDVTSPRDRYLFGWQVEAAWKAAIPPASPK